MNKRKIRKRRLQRAQRHKKLVRRRLSGASAAEFVLRQNDPQLTDAFADALTATLVDAGHDVTKAIMEDHENADA